MNRVISRNLDQISAQTLPPRERKEAARLLFIHGNILGFKNVAAQLRKYCDARDDIDAVHIDLVAPLWLKVLGKSLPLPPGCDLHQYRYLRFWSWLMSRWFRTKLPLHHFDVVHLMTQVNAGVVTRLPRRSGLPKIAVNIDATGQLLIDRFGYSRSAHGFMVRAEDRIFRASDLVVCRNAWASESLVSDFGLGEERIHIAANSIEIPAISAWDAAHRSKHGTIPRFIFVGKAWKRKGGDFILNAHQKHFADRAELHIVGPDRPSGAPGRNVHWYGYVAREELMTKILPTMDAFLLASRNDMLPWAALEAASVALPVIAPRLGALPEVVDHGRTGWLFEPGDGAAFNACVTKLLENRELCESMGKAGRAHVQSNFNPDVTYPRLLDRLVGLANEVRS